MTVVLLSGGLDSAAALFWTIEAEAMRSNVRAISIDYGQRHAIELSSARAVAELAGVEHREIAISVPWTEKRGDVLPLRNLIMLTIAAAHAATMPGPARVVIGCCEDDAATFPDCRPAFLAQAMRAITLGIGQEVVIAAPFVTEPKAAIVSWAGRRPSAWEAIARSWSCYAPTEGRPCATCGACVKRRDAFRIAGVADPALR